MTQNIFYAWPQAAYLLWGIIILLILLLSLFFYRRRQLHQFAPNSMLKRLLLPRSDFIFWLKTIALSFVWLLLTLALMQPTGYGEYPSELRKEYSGGKGAFQRQPHEVLFLIDVSKSMQIGDAHNERQRLDVAKEIADQIIERLEGQNVALDAFTSQNLSLVPPTTDYLFTRLLLRNLQINEGGSSGTDFVSALKTLQENYFSQPGLPYKSLIILSDGGDTLWETLQGAAKEQRQQEILKTVSNAQQNNLKVFAVGLGSTTGGQVPETQFDGKPVQSKLDSTLLENLSKQTGGSYYAAHDFSTIDLANTIATQINKIGFSKEKAKEAKEDLLIHKLYYQIPLGLAILLLALTLVLPDAKRSLVIGALFLLQAPLTANDAQLMREAQAQDAIQGHARARELYQTKLQEETLPDWQRAILLYNVGYSYLKENQWNQAVQTLSTVPLGDNPSPLLLYRLKRNLALAYLGMKDFDNADKSVDEAKIAYCQFESERGNKECPPNQALDLLKAEIERQRQLKKENKEQEQTPSQPKQEKAETPKEMPSEALRKLLEMSEQDKIPVPSLPTAKPDLRPW